MRSKTVRDYFFSIHRYLGLVVGLIAVIIGLTGSILVFYPEMNSYFITQKIGVITPQGQQASVSSVVESVKKAYSDRPDIKVESLQMPKKADKPYKFWVSSADDKWTEVFVNPYTTEVMGTMESEKTFLGIVYRLHYELLAGKIGLVIAGIVAFFMFVLSFTGIVLWPGWRRLISGFKIKWNAHIKRVNFDIHKVTGIVVAIFLGIIGLTGFGWNFYEHTEPLIYAATFTPKPPEPVSQPIPGKAPLTLEELISKADEALPGAATVGLSLPQKPESAVTVRKRFPEEATIFGSSRVYLDQYSGKVLQVENALQPSRANAILNSFFPLHTGMFGGLPMRIFYIFVGLAPLILFVTGFIMWQHRRRPQVKA